MIFLARNMGLLRWLLLAVACLLVSAVIASAQQTEPPAQTTTEEKPELQVIPPSQISLKAQETESVLKSMRDRPEPDPNIDKIGEDVAAALGELEDLQETSDSTLARSFSLRDLEEIERRWARKRDLVAGWASQLQDRAQGLDRDLERLQNGRIAWSNTLAAAEEAGLAEASVEVIETSIKAIEELEKKYGDRRAVLLTIQGQVSNASDIVDGTTVKLEDARKDASRFVTVEAPPIWKVFADPPPLQEQIDQVNEVRRQSREDFREFVAGHGQELIQHALGFFAILVFLLVLRYRSRRLEADSPEIEAARYTLARPVAATIVLSLVIVAFTYDNAPRVIDDVAIVALYLPLLRLIPAKAVKLLRWPVLVLFTMTIVTRYIDMLPYQSPLQRLISLAAALTTLSYMVLLLRRSTLKGLVGTTALGRIIHASAFVAAGLLGLSVIANTIGYFSIASITTNGVLMIAYLGVLFYILYQIVAAVLWIGFSTPLLQSLQVVRRHEPLIRGRILWFVRMVFAVIWIRASLRNLQVWPYVFEGSKRVLTAEAKFGDVGISLWGVLGLVFTIWVAVLLSRFVRFILEADVYPRLWLPRGVPNAISTSLHYVILTTGFFLAFAATGADLSKFAILAGAFGVGLGFGLQNVVANFVSGLILIFERPIMPGDSVEVGVVSGIVKSIGMRSTVVRTWEGAEVIVPNGKLIAEDVTNWTLSDKRRRIDIPVGVAYGTDTQQVIELLTQTAADHPDTLDDPAPRVLFLGFGDSSLDFQLRAWTLKIDNRLGIMSEVTQAVEKALADAGIEIPFPQRDLHVRSTDPGASLAPPPRPESKPKSKPKLEPDNPQAGEE